MIEYQAQRSSLCCALNRLYYILVCVAALRCKKKTPPRCGRRRFSRSFSSCSSSPTCRARAAALALAQQLKALHGSSIAATIQLPFVVSKTNNNNNTSRSSKLVVEQSTRVGFAAVGKNDWKSTSQLFVTLLNYQEKNVKSLLFHINQQKSQENHQNVWKGM